MIVTPKIIALSWLTLIVVLLYFISKPEPLTAPTTQVAPITSFDKCAEAGFPIMESYPRQCRSNNGELFVEVITTASDTPGPVSQPDSESTPQQPENRYQKFNTPVTLNLDKEVSFPDELIIKLLAISDSRCPEDVQCIWAGELSFTLLFTGGDFGKVQDSQIIGTNHNHIIKVGEYIITLLKGDVKEAVVTVTKD